jgi:hypothetical protein
MHAYTDVYMCLFSCDMGVSADVYAGVSLLFAACLHFSEQELRAEDQRQAGRHLAHRLGSDDASEGAHDDGGRVRCVSRAAAEL